MGGAARAALLQHVRGALRARGSAARRSRSTDDFARRRQACLSFRPWRSSLHQSTRQFRSISVISKVHGLVNDLFSLRFRKGLCGQLVNFSITSALLVKSFSWPRPASTTCSM
jgi:hypothetical protein